MSAQVAESTRSLESTDLTAFAIQSGDQAMRRAKNYLSKYIGIHFRAVDPEYLLLEKPIWQVMVSYKLPGLAPFRVSFLDIDASTGDVIPYSDEQKMLLLSRANAYYQHDTSSAMLPQ